ncbi:MAG: rod shape-determining protein MreC [Burkholderiales bacterium]|jgi:rod shape-determining protein MreC|nr:rod shape-determining protein MreC [Burkholderiales bacterium]
MPLGTLDRRPPPLFHQGPSALTRLMVFSAVALFLMAADTRFAVTRPLRSALSILLLPLERALEMPMQALHSSGEYVGGLHQAQADLAKSQALLTAQSAKAARVDTLIAENNRLRALADLRPALSVKSQAAEVLYEASDPFSRKIFIDRGLSQGVVPGSPVIDEAGVLGQVTRVYPLSSEVTLLIDKEAAIPVLNTRTHQRSAAFGADGSAMELRFMAGNADVKVGDVLQTSGVDGIYPPGLDVARVAKVDPRADSSFARIALAPTASADGVRHVLVLEPMAMQLPPRPAPEPEPAPAKGQKANKGTKK